MIDRAEDLNLKVIIAQAKREAGANFDKESVNKAYERALRPKARTVTRNLSWRQREERKEAEKEELKDGILFFDYYQKYKENGGKMSHGLVLYYARKAREGEAPQYWGGRLVLTKEAAKALTQRLKAREEAGRKWLRL